MEFYDPRMAGSQLDEGILFDESRLKFVVAREVALVEHLDCVFVFRNSVDGLHDLRRPVRPGNAVMSKRVTYCGIGPLPQNVTKIEVIGPELAVNRVGTGSRSRLRSRLSAARRRVSRVVIGIWKPELLGEILGWP